MTRRRIYVAAVYTQCIRSRSKEIVYLFNWFILVQLAKKSKPNRKKICSRVAQLSQIVSILNQESKPRVQTRCDPVAVSVCLLKSGVADLVLAAR